MCPPVRVAGVSPAPGPLPEPSNPQHEGKFSILGSVQSDRNFHPDFCKTSCQVEYNAHSQGSSSSASRTWPEAARSALGLSQGAGGPRGCPRGQGPTGLSQGAGGRVPSSWPFLAVQVLGLPNTWPASLAEPLLHAALYRVLYMLENTHKCAYEYTHTHRCRGEEARAEKEWESTLR